MHKNVEEAWEALPKPQFWGVIFGGFTPNSALNIRGVILQLFSIVMFTLGVLMILGKISQHNLVIGIGLTAWILVSIVMVYWWQRK